MIDENSNECDIFWKKSDGSDNLPMIPSGNEQKWHTTFKKRQNKDIIDGPSSKKMKSASGIDETDMEFPKTDNSLKQKTDIDQKRSKKSKLAKNAGKCQIRIDE